MALPNTVVYREEWVKKIQARLKRPTNWKEVCRVEYTDSRVLNNPYMSTEPTIQNGTRDTAFSFQEWALTNEAITINTYRELGTYIDRADLAQTGFGMQMERADRQAQLMNEKIENAMLASHADWTDFDNATIGGAAGNITVSAQTVDDMIRAMKREVREGNGQSLMSQNGAFFVWRPADFEYLEAFVQARIVGLVKSLLIDLETLLQRVTGRKESSLTLALS